VSAIRVAAAADAPAIARIYRPIVESTAVSFETEPPDDDEIRRRIGDTLETHPWLVCDLDGVVAGYAYASRHRVRAAYQWSVDVSVYVDGRRRRRGVARGLYTSLFAILAAQGFFNAFAGIALPNAASVALHEHLGFEPVGVYRHVGFKLGAWHDVGWWQRPLQPDHQPEGAPLALPVVRETAAWDRLLQSGGAMIRRERT
jgi:phosphinothricin acetyltransferase